MATKKVKKEKSKEELVEELVVETSYEVLVTISNNYKKLPYGSIVTESALPKDKVQSYLERGIIRKYEQILP